MYIYYTPLLLLTIIIQNCSHALSTYGERRVSICLLGILRRDCVYDIVSSLDYLIHLLCNTWNFMFLTDPFKLMWSRGYICNLLYYQIKMGRIKISHFAECFHGCASEVFVPSQSTSNFIDIPGFPFIFTVQCLMWANSWVHYDLKFEFAWLLYLDYFILLSKFYRRFASKH